MTGRYAARDHILVGAYIVTVEDRSSVFQEVMVAIVEREDEARAPATAACPGASQFPQRHDIERCNGESDEILEDAWMKPRPERIRTWRHLVKAQDHSRVQTLQTGS
jgi:hypothetical protein